MIVTLIEKVYSFLWGDLVQIPLPGGSTLGISLLIILLIPTGIYFTVRTRFLPIRLFPDMVQALVEKKQEKNSLSSFQTLIVSTATRVGMGNLVGVVAAISAGGAGAVFWMWVTAIIGSSTAFIEATLAQLYKEKDPLYGGQKADLLFFYPTKECLQFLYVTVIEVMQSVKDIDTVGFIPGTGKEFLRGYAKVFTDAQKFVHRGHCLAD